jgi:hypothetical protein
VGLTSLFGMGRGGLHRNSHHKDLIRQKRIDINRKKTQSPIILGYSVKY